MTEPRLLKIFDRMIAVYPDKSHSNELILFVGKQYQGITKLKKYKRVPIVDFPEWYKNDSIVLH